MMNLVKNWSVVLVAAVAAACGAADDAEVIEGAPPSTSEPVAAGVESQAAAGDGAARSPQSGPTSAASEVARVDFEDGNQVRFDRFGEGLLISEVGPATNTKHYFAVDDETPAETFRRLAPRREPPRALLEIDRELYPLGAKSIAGRVQIEHAPPSAKVLEKTSPTGSDVQHTGQFQQSSGLLPFSWFSQNMCNFAVNSPGDFKHGNSTGAHSHIIAKANKAYVAGGADIGDFTIKFCVDNDTNCNAPFQVNPGQTASLNYDAGLSCTKKCEWWNVTCQILGDVQVCTPKFRRVSTTTAGLSSGERHHDCGAFTEQ